MASANAATQTYACLELLIVFTLSIVVGHVYLYSQLGQTEFLNTYVWPSVLTVVVLSYLNFRSGLYGIDRLSRFAANAGAAVGNLLLAFAVIALVGAASGSVDDFSRLWFGFWLLLAVLAVLVTRAVAARIFSNQSVRSAISSEVALYGAGEPLLRALQALGGGDSGARIAGIYGPDVMPGENRPAPSDGGLADLVEYARTQHIDTVVIALPQARQRSLSETIATLSALPAEIKLMPDIGGQDVPLHGISTLGRATFIDLQHKPLSGWGRLVKATEDYAIASVAILLLLPVLAIIALAVRLDSPGPVIFRQKRHGLNNQVINVFKFRTMHVQSDNETFRQATRNDRRVTRVGRFLRRTSLDELPQFFNVLRGEMSIVGPRPHAVEMNAAYSDVLPLYDTRHRVKPGITGWAQINDHRGPTRTVDDMRARLDHDLHYIENWSLLFDLSIIAATPFIGLTHKNAL